MFTVKLYTAIIFNDILQRRKSSFQGYLLFLKQLRLCKYLTIIMLRHWSFMPQSLTKYSLINAFLEICYMLSFGLMGTLLLICSLNYSPMRFSAKSIFSLNLFVFLIGLCLFKQNHTSALGCSRQFIAFETRHTVQQQPSLLSSTGLISLGMKSVTR